MKETIYGVVVTTVVMLITSGVVALATAAPRDSEEDAAAEAYVAELLDSHYAEARAQTHARP